jgi:hypothetical protein
MASDQPVGIIQANIPVTGSGPEPETQKMIEEEKHCRVGLRC